LLVAVFIEAIDRPGLLKEFAELVIGCRCNITFNVADKVGEKALILSLIDCPTDSSCIEERAGSITGLIKVSSGSNGGVREVYVEALDAHAAFANTLISVVSSTDLIYILHRLPSDDRARIYNLLPPEHLASVVRDASREIIEEIASTVPPQTLAKTCLHLPIDELVDFIQLMPGHVRKTVVKALPEEVIDKAKPLFKYPPDSAGGIMTVNIPVVSEKSSLIEVMNDLKSKRYDIEDVVFVVDQNGLLKGYVKLSDMFREKPTVSVTSIMRRDFVAVHPFSDQEEVAKIMIERDLSMVPVVDHDGKLLGVITVQDIVDVIQAEYSEDILKLGGLKAGRRFMYISSRVKDLAFSRLKWLLLIYVIQSITANIISSYESLIERAAIIAAFIPLILDTGGNVGSQSSTVLTRALATGEVTTADLIRVIRREALTSIIMGIPMAAVGFIFSLLIAWLEVEVAVAVSLSLFIVVSLINIVGSLLPIIATKIGIDPAVLSGPLITTIADVVGIGIYLAIAYYILVI